MSERKVLTVTTFERDGSPDAGNHDWYWHTQTLNNEVVADGGEGYTNLSGATHGFFASQGVKVEDAWLGSEFSNLIQVDTNKFKIIKYEKET